jgi:hypothetical protein
MSVARRIIAASEKRKVLSASQCVLASLRLEMISPSSFPQRESAREKCQIDRVRRIHRKRQQPQFVQAKKLGSTSCSVDKAHPYLFVTRIPPQLEYFPAEEVKKDLTRIVTLWRMARAPVPAFPRT